jgi:integrase
LSHVPVPQLVIDLGLLDRKKDIEAAGGKTLFPEWKTYTHTSGRVMHGHHFSKSWQYMKKVFKFDRAELTLYGRRHTRAGWYDELNLPDRVRARVLGHANKSVAARYGANKLTPGEAELTAQTLPIQEKIAEILLEAKIKVEKKTLKALRTW